MRPFRTEDEGRSSRSRSSRSPTATTAHAHDPGAGYRLRGRAGGEPAGYVAIEESAADALDRTALRASGPREGGRRHQLLDWAEGYAISNGADRLEVVVERGNDRAVSFYRGRGFVPTGPDLLELVLPQACSVARRPRGGARSSRQWPPPTRGSSARSPPTAPCWRPRRRTSNCSSTTRSARRAAIRSSTRGAARCSPARRTGCPATTARSCCRCAPASPRAPYSVRWRVVSNDGHLVTGVLAFAVARARRDRCRRSSAGGGVSTRLRRPPFPLPRRRAGRRRSGAHRARPARARPAPARDRGRQRRAGSDRWRRSSACWRSSRPPMPPASAA